MSEKELQRVKVIENAVEGRLTVLEAAELLQISDRQVKRLKRDYDGSDAAWVHHGNQGREASNAICEDLGSRWLIWQKRSMRASTTAIFTRS